MNTSFLYINEKAAPITSVIKQIAKMDEKYVGCEPQSSDTGYLTDAKRMLLMSIVSKDVETVVGKIEYTLRESLCEVKWVCAPGFGKPLLEEFEHCMERWGIEKIQLVCALNDSESAETVARRTNFWLHRGYSVTNVRFETFDPSNISTKLDLEKKINKSTK